MADYLVAGKKGGGKTLFCVDVMREALRKGRRVATNIDLDLGELLPPLSRATYMRVPDKPTADDLIALGRGQEGVDEENNGVLVLDEASAFLNSREWNSKERAPLLEWIIHSRKYGWDTYFIAQGQEQLDKQMRTTQLEYCVAVKNTKKWRMPLISAFTETFLGFKTPFPHFHIGIIKHGLSHDALTIGRRMFKGTDLYKAYDTAQVFADRQFSRVGGVYTGLSAYHVKGRYMSRRDLYRPVLISGGVAGLVLGVIIGLFSGYAWFQREHQKPPEIKVDDKLVVIGVFDEGLKRKVLLNDGSVQYMVGERTDDTGHYYKVGQSWVKVTK